MSYVQHFLAYLFTVTLFFHAGLQSGAALAAPSTPTTDFTVNNDGTATHMTTGLTWKRCAEGQSWSGSTCTGTAQTYTWAAATALTGTFGGKSDWRLPTIAELVTIVERDITNPSINPTVFPSTSAYYFWSGTTYAGSSDNARFVDFGSGNNFYYDKTSSFPVRLVRGGQLLNSSGLYTPTPDFSDLGNGIVTHNKTSLTWKRCAEGQTWDGVTCTGTTATYTWMDAIALAQSYAGYSDWRLPTQNELLTLAEWSATPAINPTIFPNTSTKTYFWSGSSYIGKLGFAWMVNFTDGSDYYANGRTNSFQIRLVRGGYLSPLSGLSISCPSTINSGAGGSCSATASYSDASSKLVSANWSSSNPTVLSVNNGGGLVAITQGADTSVTISASYTENGVTRTAIAPITVKAAATSLTPMVAAGDRFALALRTDGSVVSWGRNDYGQLGNGQAALRTSPAKIAGIDHVISVVAGNGSTLVLRDDGSVWGWGGNGNGELGDGTTQNKSHPVAVKGITGVVKALASTSSHVLAVTADGGVWAWGYGGKSQLGNVSIGDSSTAIKLSGLPSTQTVAAGQWHSLALAADGSVWSWGDNSKGQLGDGGITTARVVPARIAALLDIVAISSKANNNLALDKSGQVWSWGYGGAGALGSGSNGNRTTPAIVSGLPKIVSIVAGNLVSAAIAEDGSVWMWGDNNFGQFGDNQYGYQPSPIKMAALKGYSGISVGDMHAVGYNPGGILQAWGVNSYGQLGVSDVSDRPSPVAVTGVPQFKQISAGGSHTVAVTGDGSVWAWGSNGGGELADGTVAVNNIPGAVQGLGKIAAVAVGAFHSLALAKDGSVWAWGGNANGALGNDTLRNSALPQRIAGLTNVTAVSAGQDYSLGLDANGTVWSWGYAGAGRLGNGITSGNYPKPQPLTSFPGAIRISAGSEHALALRSDGSVWAWGLNNFGQVGDGTTTDRSTPTRVADLSNIFAVAAGGFHSLALDRSGNVWAWGNNCCGQLGDVSSPNSTVPVRIADLVNVVAIAAGLKVSYAITTDGRVWAWGYNGEGELGAGTISAYTPHASPITDIANFQGISGGSGSAVALRTDGTVWAWGRNFEGQIGDATFAQRNTPALTLDTTGDRALDLDPATPNVIPQAKLPPFLIRAFRSGDLSQLTLSIEIKPGSFGTDGIATFQGFSAACSPCDVYVAATLPANAVFMKTTFPDGKIFMENEGRNWVDWLPEWLGNGAFPVFIRGFQFSTGEALKLKVLGNTDTNAIPFGTEILAGYGSSGQEMLAAKRHSTIFTKAK